MDPFDKTMEHPMSEEDIEEILDSPMDTNNQIERALQICVVAHAHQRDKGDAPYAFHPIRVALDIKRAGLDEEVVAAALLHDIIEDTPLTYSVLMCNRGISRRCAILVDTLTRQPERYESDETYHGYIKRIAKDSEDAILIKLADIQDNLAPSRQLGTAEGISLTTRYSWAREYLLNELKKRKKKQGR